jgi:putative copper resistance protein D
MENVSLILQVIPEWLELVSLACCFGVLVFSLWVVPRTPGDGAAGHETLLAGLRRLLVICTGVLLASSILALLVSSAEMSGYPISGIFPVLPTVLLRTHLGHTWILRGMAIAVLSLAMTTRASRRSRPTSYVMLGCALVVSAMDSASGHPSDAGDLSVAEFLDWLHLIAALVWGGGLLVLSWAILPRLVKHGNHAARSMAGIASRFSRIAGGAVGFIALTAPYQTWAYGGGVEELATSPYGRILVAKIVLFFLLLVLGAFNRYVSVPRLHEWAVSAAEPRAAAQFTRTVKLEALLVLAVLLCAALLRHQVPARHSVHPEHHPMAACGAYPESDDVREDR